MVGVGVEELEVGRKVVLGVSVPVLADGIGVAAVGTIVPSGAGGEEGVEGVDRVGQFMFGHFLTKTGSVVASKTLRAIKGSQHNLHQHEGKGILRSPRGGFVSQGNVGRVLRVELDTVV